MPTGTYTALTAISTNLYVDVGSRRLVHGYESASGLSLAFIHIPLKSRLAFVLFDNPQSLVFSTLDRKPSGPIIPLLWRSMPDGSFAFFEFAYGSYLVALSDISEAGVGTVCLAAPGLDQGNRFKLTEAADLNLLPTIRNQIALIERLAVSDPGSIMDVLRDTSGSDRPTAASLLAGMLTPSEVETFVDYLFEDRERLNTLASLFPEDPWAEVGLPLLFDFVRARRARETIRTRRVRCSDIPHIPHLKKTLIGPELDKLAVAALPGEPLAFSHRCVTVARSKVAPVRDFCIVLTARNDGLYILDWLAYHQAIGVERVFIYTNDNQDGSDELLRVLADAGEISLIDSTLSIAGVSPVSKAYGHALSILPEVLDYRWCAIVDSDEYIGLDRETFTSIKSFVEWQELQHVDVIFLNWVMLGSSGAIRWEDEPVTTRFCEKYLDVHVKAIFRPRFFHHALPHFPYTRLLSNVTSRNAAGDLHPSFTPYSPEPRDNPAWIAHYFFRSFEEFFWKFSRGRGDQPLLSALQQAEIPEGFMNSFIAQQRDLRLVPDTRVLAFAHETATQLQRLKAIPGVLEALGVIKNHYNGKAEQLEATLRLLQASASPTQSEFYGLFFNSKHG